ncbi:karyopherin Kap95 [Vermiconidia calcicola]|uniref:Karyopherin Kap95 n=1 Tax=Vermiconidia calcicola TaxID=1690605 RepID=A0ACC3NYX3_9PEZI|nr:karyopherin Kap95 [Vermiconidia calcicola]
MDVNQVLTGTLSPDASIRSSAEQQLSQAAEADFPGYLITLSRELANDQAQSQVRIAAGLALKNSFSARDFARLREVQNRWLTQIDPQIKQQVKDFSIQTLGSTDSRAGQSSAQFIASIAAIELPREQWPELMPALVENVGSGTDQKKQSSLTTIGFICETEDTDLRDSLAQHSNAILTAVVQGARKEEPNNDIRNAAISALGDSLEFVRTNFENEGERNYIMQVICEATQADDSRIQQGSYGCLNRIMGLYYDKMRFYMEKALFGLTIQGMRSDEDDVAKLAVEFWCTVCEEEISIEDDNAQAQAEGTELRPYFNFARVATQEVVPVLLELLAKQDEDATDDEYNVSRAAYQCVQLWAQAVGSQVVPPILSFVEGNLRSEDWHYRDAAVSAFGAMMEGPDEKVLDPLVKQALPVLIGMMSDQSVHVKDSAAYALGRICEAVSESIDPREHLQPLITALFGGLTSHPKMASSCCWALMNLADRFAGEPGCQTNALSQHFQASVQHLLQVTEQTQDNQLRTAAYEVLNAFVTNAANDSVQMVASLSDVIIDRLEKTIPMQSQVVSVEDRLTLEEIQTSLTSVVMAIIQRLEKEILPQSDRIMQLLLSLLSNLGGKSSVPDTIFACIGALANALEDGFEKYMQPFSPYLLNALNNQEEPQLCAMAIGLVSDITRALEGKVQPFCDPFMNSLLNNLRSTTLGNQFKPAILQCFGDIAQAIGGEFETYLSVVAQVLQQAAGISVQSENTNNFEMLDYVVSLREGIMDAWGGIIMAMRAGNKANLLEPYIESIFQLLQTVYQDPNRTEALLRSSMGVVGDISEAFPAGNYSTYFRHEWLTAMCRETRANKEFTPRTQETARWAREQIKRQAGYELTLSKRRPAVSTPANRWMLAQRRYQEARPPPWGGVPSDIEPPRAPANLVDRRARAGLQQPSNERLEPRPVLVGDMSASIGIGLAKECPFAKRSGTLPGLQCDFDSD